MKEQQTEDNKVAEALVRKEHNKMLSELEQEKVKWVSQWSMSAVCFGQCFYDLLSVERCEITCHFIIILYSEHCYLPSHALLLCDVSGRDVKCCLVVNSCYVT